jgi:pyrrolidone-carboxylate peptidase
MYQEIYLTGFKKFGNVAVNPTELIVDELTK